MSLVSFTPVRSAGRIAVLSLLVVVILAVLAAPARAQDTPTTESAIKEAFLDDLEVMRGKFIGLAEAFPADTYTWRPMDGVRSVAEVLMLIAVEGYGFVPNAFGGQPALSREESQALRSVTDKAQVIDHLTKGFAHAKEQVESVDPATLVGVRSFFGREMSMPQVVHFVAGDMHEHLGQLIAYARTNQIVPPWSR